MRRGEKIIVPYQHDPADVQTIHLAVVSGAAVPGPDDWRPALRDTVGGRPVVWARFAKLPERPVSWLRDRDGARRVTPWTPPLRS